MRLARADAWYLISPGRSCIAPASREYPYQHPGDALMANDEHVALLKQGVGGQWPGTT